MNNRKMIKMSLLLVTVLLCGCQQLSEKKATYVKNRSKDYLTSSLIAPLQVPNSLSQPNVTETYPLPAHLPAPGSLQPVSLVPPGFGKLS